MVGIGRVVEVLGRAVLPGKQLRHGNNNVVRRETIRYGVRVSVRKRMEGVGGIEASSIHQAIGHHAVSVGRCVSTHERAVFVELVEAVETVT